MLFDGGRALLIGDYVRPSSGEYAGQLGPWAHVVSAAGLSPESVVVKLLMTFCGAAAIVASALFLRSGRRTRFPLIASAAAVLWYVPFGTVTGLAALAAVQVNGSSRFESPRG
jgi:hypothetical protein